MSPPLLHLPTPSTLSFSSHLLSDSNHFFLTSTFSHLSIAKPPPSTTIRMGGGPRTYPGGVSKWQWKRMQAKKAKQLLRARLARERQIYEMRKRAELSAAVSDLERPWEAVEKAPKLFSVTADEQLKVLADRFQKPGGFDLWSEEDGPQLFETVEGIASARFFPKGVVHSIKPYGRITDGDSQREVDLVHRDTDNDDHDVDFRGLDRNSGLIQKNSRNSDDNDDGFRVSDRYSDLIQKNSRNSDDNDDGFRGLDQNWGLIQKNSRNLDDNDDGFRVSDQNPGLIQKNSRNSNRGSVKLNGRRRISTLLGSGSGSGGDELNQSGSESNWRKGSKRGNERKQDDDKFRVLDRNSGFIQMNSRTSNVESAKLNGRRRVSTRSGPDSDGGELNQRGSQTNWRKGSMMGNGRKQKQQSGLNSKVFDMNLLDDGSYGLSKKETEVAKSRRRPERK